MNKLDETTFVLDEMEREVINLFVRMADVLNQPRSLGEIYGLLFISPIPLCLDDCRFRLKISKGSTSQGLKILREIGAIHAVDIPGDRKDYYVPETSLRQMAAGFADEKIVPHVESGGLRIQRIRKLLAESDRTDCDEVGEKIDVLENWQKRAGKMLPIILKLIGG